jgi:hypothetical protein
MQYNIFFSWQSDLPSGVTRTFIEEALKRAASTVAKEDTIDVEPVIDRDTTGVPGSPDISSTIIAKIDDAQAFVADVTIINQGHPDG